MSPTTADIAPLAHSAHWIESVLILVPTLGFIGWLVVVTVRERRRGAGEDLPPPG